jgi:ammonium transporter, Amt family
VLPLLRSSAVRLVKIDAALTTAAMKDKLSQAIVVAISQAAKVLGAHCVAKRIESTMARQWLSAIGVDFAQGFLLEGLMPLAALSDAARDGSGTQAS